MLLFLLGATLEATLGAKADASPYYLRAATDFLIITLCLPESIFKIGDKKIRQGTNGLKKVDQNIDECKNLHLGVCRQLAKTNPTQPNPSGWVGF